MFPALLLCFIIGIADGDTLKARCDHETLSIRLADIDAPEKGQPFGRRSKQALGSLCFRQSAEVRPVSLDRYGRNAGTEQVQAGLAWVFVRYAPRDSPLYGLEGEARAARRGLWSESHPMAPWEWRKNSMR